MDGDPKGEIRRAAQDRTQMGRLAALLDGALDRPEVVFVSADASRSFRLSPRLCSAPGKVIEVGVAEASAIGIGYGLSLRGFRPFVLGFSTFLLLRGLEQVRSLVSYHEADVTLLGGMSGLTNSRDGFMHQSTDDVGILSGIGKVRVLTPSDASSLAATAEEMFGWRGPKFVRLYRTEIDLGREALPLSGWRPVATRLDFGDDFALVSYGRTMQECAEAATVLRADGLCGKLVEVLQLQPFDDEALREAVGGVGLVCSVEDHLIQSGLGGRLRASLRERRDPPRGLVTLGLEDGRYGSSGSLQELLAGYGLDARSIARAVAAELSKRATP